jgi:hypothetical protein
LHLHASLHAPFDRSRSTYQRPGTRTTSRLYSPRPARRLGARDYLRTFFPTVSHCGPVNNIGQLIAVDRRRPLGLVSTAPGC